MVESAVIMGDPSQPAIRVVKIFERHTSKLALGHVTKIPQVVDAIRHDLADEAWAVSTGDRSKGGVLVGRTSRQEVHAEAIHPAGVVLWVETGRSWANFAFLQRAVDAAFFPDVSDVVLAVRQRWNSRVTYDRCRDYLLDLTESRVVLPYRSLTLVGF